MHARHAAGLGGDIGVSVCLHRCIGANALTQEAKRKRKNLKNKEFIPLKSKIYLTNLEFCGRLAIELSAAASCV